MEKAAEKIRLPELLHAAVRHFRSGEDAAGLEDFISAVNELESAAEADPKSRPFRVNELLPALRELYVMMQNYDITGLTDWLEYTASPMAEKWLEGCGEA